MDGRFKKGIIPWNKNPVKKTCMTCGKIFYISKSRNNDGRGKFDNIICKREYKYKLANNFKMSGDLAELIGVIIGDGCINKTYNRNNYRIQILLNGNIGR